MDFICLIFLLILAYIIYNLKFGGKQDQYKTHEAIEAPYAYTTHFEDPEDDRRRIRERHREQQRINDEEDRNREHTNTPDETEEAAAAFGISFDDRNTPSPLENRLREFRNF